MSQSSLGYIIGGIIPAILLGIYSIIQKYASERGIGPGTLLIFIGLGSILVGLVYSGITRESTFTLPNAGIGLLTGVCWALATALIQVAMYHFQMPVSKLVPLFNMNTLVAVGLGLVFFQEWSVVNGFRLSIAAVLVVAGGILAANS